MLVVSVTHVGVLFLFESIEFFINNIVVVCGLLVVSLDAIYVKIKQLIHFLFLSPNTFLRMIFVYYLIADIEFTFEDTANLAENQTDKHFDEFIHNETRLRNRET